MALTPTLWLLSGVLAVLDTLLLSLPVLGLAVVFLPACLVLVPCQLYLYVVASRHYRSEGVSSQQNLNNI